MSENRKIYYIVAPGSTAPNGPFSLAELRVLMQRGQVTDAWLYVVDGMNEWRPLSTLPGLYAAQAPVVVPMPAPSAPPVPSPAPVSAMPVMPPNTMYYLTPPGSNRIKGPYSLERIALMLNRRKITLQWNYSEPGSMQWRPLADMPALRNQLLPNCGGAPAPRRPVPQATEPASSGMVWSIIFLLLGVWPGLNIICLPAGTVAVVMSILTMVHNSRGNYNLSHRFAAHSRTWRIVAMIPEGIFYTVLLIVAIGAAD